MLFPMLVGLGTSRGQVAPDGVTQTAPAAEKPNPLKRRLSDREKFQQQKELKYELKGVYKTWLDQDVRWLITDTEAQAFKHLTNDEERDSFIENFWQRRNPNPDSPDNEFRDEVYARIAYANEHFAAGKPGWMTDRGHIYIAYGKPDDIDSHPSGGQYQRPMEEGGGETATFPFETWHYRYIEGIGDNIDLEFVDTCQCGDYHYTIDRSEKDALKHVPGAGLTMSEQNGQSEKKDRFSGGGIEELGAGPMTQQNQNKQFDRIDLGAKIMAPPPIKFKDLEQFMASSKILTGPPFLFDVRTDYVKVTNDTVIVPITVQIRNSDITFDTKDGVAVGRVEVQGRISNMTHKVVQTFGNDVHVDVPSELLPAKQKGLSVYWASLALRPGLYKVDIAIKDVNNPDHIGHQSFAVNVPRYDDDTLGHSSLILADAMYRVPSKEIGAGSFVLGDTFVRPRVASVPTGGGAPLPAKFTRSQSLNFWMQVYNLGIDDKTKQNDATIEYQITDLATNKSVLNTQESASKLSPNAEQLTLEKSLPLASLAPGQYQVKIKVNDSITKQQTEESAKFSVD
ncbi:MAG: GWxTD domain-containing protein [Acidobacteriota bacterium]|nr:GWxTD domain-containing protein [Acidobacteriota bacterium]